MPKRRRHPLTQRGQILCVFAFIAFTLGLIQWLREPVAPTEGLVHTYLPTWASVGKWITAAAVAVWAAITHRYRWGYIALVAVVMFRSASYAGAWAVWLLSEGGSGARIGWVQALEYVGFAVLLVILAGPDDGTVRTAEVAGEVPTDG